MRPRLALALAAIPFAMLLIPLAGCGAGDSGDGASPTPTSSPTATGTPTPTPTASPTPTPDPEPLLLRGITDLHNEVRASVGVGPMTWSTALALTAQAWAEMCVDDDAPSGLVDHNPNRSVGHPYYVGENIYASSGSATAEDAVDSWASEAAYYDYASNTCSAVCGHYTQLVWAESVELGCGIANCPSLTYDDTIVCNYGPGGNTGGQPY